MTRSNLNRVSLILVSGVGADQPTLPADWKTVHASEGAWMKDGVAYYPFDVKIITRCYCYSTPAPPTNDCLWFWCQILYTFTAMVSRVSRSKRILPLSLFCFFLGFAVRSGDEFRLISVEFLFLKNNQIKIIVFKIQNWNWMKTGLN